MTSATEAWKATGKVSHPIARKGKEIWGVGRVNCQGYLRPTQQPGLKTNTEPLAAHSLPCLCKSTEESGENKQKQLSKLKQE